MSGMLRYRHARVGGSLAAHFEKRSDGSQVVTSAEPLGAYPKPHY
jgi:hypothetical protein